MSISPQRVLDAWDVQKKEWREKNECVGESQKLSERL